MMDNRSDTKFRFALWGIVLIAFFLRIVCALPALQEGGECLLRTDSHTYLMPARALIEDHVYWTAPGSGVPMTKRPPGCALVLSVLLTIFGGHLVPVSVLNCLASALTCYPAGLCGRLLGGRRAGYWTAFLLALNLTSLAQAPLILADSVLGLCCAWALYFVLKSWRTRTFLPFAAACVLLAVGAWFKPVNTPVLLGGMPVLALIFFGFRRRTLYAFGAVALTFLLFLFPVMLRNYRCGAEFDMDSNRGEMYYHSGSAILGAATGEDTGIIRDRLARETEKYLAEHRAEYPTTRAQNAYRTGLYLGLIRQYPGAFLRTHLPQPAMLLPDLPTYLENHRLTVTGRGTLDVLRKKGIFAALDHYLDGRFGLLWQPLPELAATGLMYLGAVMLLLIWLRRWKNYWRLLLVFGLFGFFFLFVGGPVVMPRYQIPALPMLCAMAGAWWSLIFRRFRKKA
ncbi:MAG: glycosyltransferase family 39 protein [Lentisphaeria bacterium]|nr:glycosyltransferase family 39 protein [Lentisphaeria bacterium]